MRFQKEIERITREQFGVGPDAVADNEIIYRVDNPAAFDRMKSDFDVGLSTHPDAKSVLRRSFVGPKFAVFLLAAYPADEISRIRPESRRYYPICTIEEIRRIESPSSAADVLLKMRADEIASSTRLHRVFLRRRELNTSSWALSKHFSNVAFESYVTNLPDEQRRICEQVSAGTAFLLEPNGICISSPWGPVVVISESLENYLYYMNVYLMTLDSKAMSEEDASQALYISLRTMMMTETPDFDLDPRGLAPEPIHAKAHSVTKLQMDFIIGHEYAHILGGHINSIRMAALEVLPLPTRDQPKIYSHVQEQEFAADLGSLLNPGWSKRQLIPYVYAAHLFFYGLDLLEEVTDYLRPNSPQGQHPPARDRLVRLRTELASRGLFDEEHSGDNEEMSTTFLRLDFIRKSLRDILPKADDQMKVYGSMYLHSRRLLPLFDRIDY